MTYPESAQVFTTAPRACQRLVGLVLLALANLASAQVPPPVALFNGTDTSQFQAVGSGAPVPWTLVAPDALEVVPGSGSIESVTAFNDFVLHVEFRTPSPTDAGNGNSGIYLQGRYELQIFNSAGVVTPGLNDCGAIWNQIVPSTNACLAPGQWQTYDITFRAAQWNGNVKIANARVTVVLNGSIVHTNVNLPGPTFGGAIEAPTPGPIILQDNGSAVQFRNITIQPLNTPPPSTTVFFSAAQGGGRAAVKAIKEDAAGNRYAAGYFQDRVNFGGTTLIAGGPGSNGRDGFLLRMSPGGSVDWVVPFGGTGIDECFDLALSPQGEPVITGTFVGPASFGSNMVAGFGGNDVFAAKFTTAGQLAWLRTAGGTGTDYASGVAVDASGNVFVTGSLIDGADFGTTNVTAAFAGVSTLFLAKYDAFGNLQWVGLGDDPGGSLGFRVGTDLKGNAYVGGYFTVSLLHGSTTLRSSGGRDVLVLKFDGNGLPVWATQAGGGGNDEVFGLGLNQAGEVFITGYFGGNASFGSTALNANGKSDIFLAKLNTNGPVAWVRQSGSISSDNTSQTGNLALDRAGNIYLTATTFRDATFSSIVVTNIGGEDAFVAKYDRSGTIAWVSRSGSLFDDNNRALTADAAGNVLTGGIFNGPATVDGRPVGNPGGDGFITRLAAQPPRITLQPVSATVDSGTPVTFTAAATAFNPPLYQWTLNGTNLPNATNATLVLPPTTAGHSGTYQLLVSDNLGVAFSAPAILDVQVLGSPVILTQPADQLVSEGGRVQFQVSAKGAPPLAYQWLRNGTPIPDATNAAFATLPLLVGDSGTYSVVISNAFDVTASRNALLTVVTVPEITAPLTNINVNSGEAVTLRVGAAGAALQYAWILRGQFLPGETNASLTLPAARAGDSGSYTVVVGNPAGLAVTSQATLSVDPAPAIRVHPQPAAVLLGAPTTFSVTALGEPPLSYQWQFNGVDLPGETAATLTLATTTNSSAGNYSVRVSNPSLPAGVVSSNAFLKVTGPAVRLAVTGNQGVIDFAAPAADFLLECSDSLGASAVWTLIADLSTVPGGTVSIPVDRSGGPRFYRLRKP